MTKNLLNISGKISDPIISIYALIAEVAEQNNVPFFIIGASARDIIFEHVYSIPAPRATRDIDLAIHIATWNDFTQLKDQLIATGVFFRNKEAQRLYYQNEIPVDLIPFGMIEIDGNINWPPDFSIQMSVIGFDEAYRTTALIRFRDDPALDIHVVTPAALVILKLMAWKERGHQHSKDALDLVFLLTEYINADNIERVSEEHQDLLLEDDFDYDICSARLLGRDIATIASSITKQVINELLAVETGEQEQYKLVEAMQARGNDSKFDQNLGLLEALKKGLNDKVKV
jgi:predicted nucleotidyltransferase